MKLIAPDRDIRKVGKRLEEVARENHRQSEFYSQLLNLLDLTAPIPATRGWAASPDLLLTLHHLARTSQPKNIVDLGSGISTLVLAKGAPQAKIYSFDNSAEYGEKTLKILQDHLITNVELRVAPLVSHPEGVDWYQRNAFNDIASIDLLFIDGPPGSKNSMARHPAIVELIKKLSPTAIVVIDDVEREGERALAEEFASRLPSHTLAILGHEKGTALLLPKL